MTEQLGRGEECCASIGWTGRRVRSEVRRVKGIRPPRLDSQASVHMDYRLAFACSLGECWMEG